jgi:predicted RND superfamily exporter protein
MSNRDSKVANGQRAAQILENPEFVKTFERLKDRKFRDLMSIKLDGSEVKSNQALETIRSLQAMEEVKKELTLTVQTGNQEKKRVEAKSKKKPYDPHEIKGN